MDKVIAANLIQELFEQSFSKEKFIYFIKNLLNNIKDDTFIYRGNYIPEIYRGYIKTIERIGKYQDLNEKKVDILIVTLEKETTLERARTLQRNIIAWYLNGSRGGQLKDAALVAFVSPNNNDWRFSYVKMEYKFVKTSKGIVKVKEELTPAKRYSFLVGPNEASHTAQSQMVPTLINDKIDPTLEEIEKIFNIETVSKEFFDQYRLLYEMLVKELDNNQTFKNEASKNNIKTSNFARKLLGQIVFLYFLQKKGWLGVDKGKTWGEGDKFFLSNLFKNSLEKNKNYFNDYLEILFYDTLNNARSEKVDRNYSDHFESKIPFLNGGLFEPQYDWKKSFIYLDNKIFKQILDVFDLYNFTVKEDEPLEKDVAVDPEMLGKVFENLLEENLRKGKGTYYTPREIVHYMCQESLINYLQTSTNIDEQIVRKLVLVDKTINPVMDLKKQIKEKSLVLSNQQVEEFDQALNNITICDPACGSGAFLVGMLQLIVSTKNKINGYKQLFEMNIEDKTEYDLKKRTIQNSIYGVDIDSGAVEIAKLRLWLSLVVDYDLEDIEPLPNLDYKIMVGNSLIEKMDSNKIEKTMDDEKNKLIDEVKNLKEKYFETSELKSKTNLRFQINETIRLLINYDNKQERDKIWSKILDKKNQLKMFAFDDDQKSFADISSDYKKLQTLDDVKETDHFEWHIHFNEVFEKGGFNAVIANPPYIRIHKQNQDAKIKETIKRTYISAYKDFDYYVLFIEKGLNILRQNGVLTYITPDKYLVREYGSKIRSLIFQNSILELFDLSRSTDIFDAATYPLISIIQKNNALDKIHIKIANSIKNLSKDYKELTVLKQKCIKNDRIDIIDPSFDNLLSNILSNSVPLAEVLNNDQLFCGTPRAKDYHSWSNYITSDKRSKKSLRVLVCSNLQPYSINTKKKIRTVGLSIVAPYFNNDKNIISEKRWGDYTFTPKILIRGNDTRITAVLDEEGSVFIGIYGIKIYGEIIKDYKYLLTLLNSKLYQWIFSIQNPSIKIGGGFFSINSPHILKLPFKKISEKLRYDFDTIADKIIAITKSYDYFDNPSKKEKVQEYGKQIDQMVYTLYGLTKEEIEVVENKL